METREREKFSFVLSEMRFMLNFSMRPGQRGNLGVRESEI